ncbi:MAG TPA: PIG-L family deacetylase [Rudaea sp.]
MPNLLQLAAGDRLLVFAPHPDDESIATGGLLQVARESGASCRVVLVTDGDNNPWPQRWIEKRWRIDAEARARWGARRRAEARTALHVLGFGDSTLRFCGFPDTGLTDLLMRDDPTIATQLGAQIDEFRPTLIALPSLSDRHPDHSALHVLVRLALSTRAGPAPQLLAFAVHGAGSDDAAYVVLSAAQREIKARAILSHTSQMRLSSRRFLAFARERETFDLAPTPPQPMPAHPITATVRDAQLHVRLSPPVGSMLRVVLDGTAQRLHCKIALRGRRDVAIVDSANGMPLGTATMADDRVVLPLPASLGALRQGFLKLGRAQAGLFVFDRSGWQVVAGDAAAVR